LQPCGLGRRLHLCGAGLTRLFAVRAIVDNAAKAGVGKLLHVLGRQLPRDCVVAVDVADHDESLK
jgi:hypothetical protein